MRILNLIYLALFTIGSSAEHMHKRRTPKPPIKTPVGKNWVVLVAGSFEWENYRHQADICHAYQIIRSNGIPKENIITMMVDDIANHTNNPARGTIINQPNGEDVYKGVIIDYTGEDVNPKNFLNVITGNKKAMASIGTGKVIIGGPYDKIFVNFADHGDVGLLVFPNEFLYADELNEALNQMYARSIYGKMLWYIEACNSGSLFDGIISENKKSLMVTAAGPRESSYGYYCGSESGKYKTCLGDMFSVTWMEDLDLYNPSSNTKSVFNHFNMIRTKVYASNVMIYGDFSVGQNILSEFIGKPYEYRYQSLGKQNTPQMHMHKELAVSSQDVNEHTIHQLMANDKHKLAEKLDENNKMRIVIDGVFKAIYLRVLELKPDMENGIGSFDEPHNLDLSLDIFPCYRSILNQITESCFSMPRNPYSLKRIKIFANICIIDKTFDQMVNNVIDEICVNVPKNIYNVF